MGGGHGEGFIVFFQVSTLSSTHSRINVNTQSDSMGGWQRGSARAHMYACARLLACLCMRAGIGVRSGNES